VHAQDCQGAGIGSVGPLGGPPGALQVPPHLGQEVQELLGELRREWPGGHYNLFRRNCIHFSEALCKKLLVNPLPKWIRSLVNTLLIRQTYGSSDSYSS